MKEREMREPVANWFRKQGYECAYERFFASGYCDILAFKFAPQTSRRIPDLLEAIAIELKLSDVGGALFQAHGYWWGGARSFVAMPLERCKKMRESTRQRFWDMEIGLLSVSGDDVSQLDPSPARDGVERLQYIQWMQKKLWRAHRKAGTRIAGFDEVKEWEPKEDGQDLSDGVETENKCPKCGYEW